MTTPPVPIDPQIFQALNGPGPTSSALEGQFGSGIEIFNVRVFPVLRAPNAAGYLNGLSLADAFRRYVLDDPEVVALGKRVVKTTKRHADVFRDGMFPRPWTTFIGRWTQLPSPLNTALLLNPPASMIGSQRHRR